MNLEGNSDFQSEDLIAYELGYRTQLTPKLYFDIAVFYNDYSNIRFQKAGDTIVDPLLTPIEIDIPVSFNNDLDIKTHGLEVMARWEVARFWKLVGNYSWLKMKIQKLRMKMIPFRNKLKSLIRTSGEPEVLSGSSACDPMDTSLYYFSHFYNTPAHLRCDVRLGWKPLPEWELSFKVENLFDDQHQEFPDNLGFVSSDVPRNWFAEMKYRF